MTTIDNRLRISYSPNQQKHKHLYKDCLLICAELDNKAIKGKYCALCGKINDVQMISSSIVNNHYKILNNKDILREYADLPQVPLKRLTNKYVDFDSPIN